MRIEADGVTLANAPALAAAGAAALAAGDCEFDFGAVRRADSSAVALLLDWQRSAEAAGRTLRLVNLPPAVTELADLYGVASLLGLALAGQRPAGHHPT
jgi:phospholipid transport system transporter-binding protein